MARGWWIVVLVLTGCGGDDDGGGDGAGTADAMAEGDAEPPPSTCDPAERQTRDRADEVSGYQIHVVVALPSDGEDRQLDTSGVLAATVSVWNGWLDEAAGGSHLRLDTCDGELDVTFARLTESDADIAATGAYVRDRVEALSFAGSGDPPGYLEFAMLHEIVHTLGMVAEAAPHHNLAGHCDDTAGTDLMYAGPDPWYASVLDQGHDDYYDHGQAMPDLAKSAFLDPTPADPELPPAW